MPRLRRWVPGLLPLISNTDWNAILTTKPECAILSTQCVLRIQHEEPDDMLDHHIQEHDFLAKYGSLFTDLWCKAHLTQTTFVTPCDLCQVQKPKLSADTSQHFQLLKHNRPVIVQLASISSHIVEADLDGRIGGHGRPRLLIPAPGGIPFF